MQNPTRTFSAGRPRNRVRSRELDDAIAEEEIHHSRRKLYCCTVLGKCPPKTLRTLWRQCEFSFPGRKVARLFTSSERGKREVARSLWGETTT